MKPRHYQISAQQKIHKAWADGARSVLCPMATGLGKTILAAMVIRSTFPRRAMFLVHRQELAFQAKARIEEFTGFSVGIEMGERKTSEESCMFFKRPQVVIATIQTLMSGGDGGGRLGKFNPDHFGTLLCDEAHHSVAPEWIKGIDYFKSNEKLKIFGMTATPDRADEQALGKIYDSVVYENEDTEKIYDMLFGIKDGWLVPVEQEEVLIEGFDLSDVRSTAGDLNGADLNAVMEKEKNLYGIAGASFELLGAKRRGIGFAASVIQAKMMSDIYNRKRHGMSAWVCGTTDYDERQQIVRDFKLGKIQFLWNCGVFAEGFDDFGVEDIVMARPTESRSLYAQMAGRATRPHEDIAHSLNNFTIPAVRRAMIARSAKPSCRIIDCVGISGKHKLITTADILGGDYSEAVINMAKELTRKAGKAVRMDKVLADAEEQVKRAEAKKEREDEEQERKRYITAKVTFKTRKIDPFNILEIRPVRAKGWDAERSLSEKQRKVLKNAGFNPDELGYNKGRQLVGILVKRFEGNCCSLPQAEILKRYKLDVNMTRQQAHDSLDIIAANGWRLPHNFTVPEDRRKQAAEHKAPADDNVPF